MRVETNQKEMQENSKGKKKSKRKFKFTRKMLFHFVITYCLFFV
jgi:hypothetical protein